MRGNTFGHFFSLTTFGESHGPAMGALIDGCPAGVELKEADFSEDLRRRRPGQSAVTTDRDEKDAPRILSGVFEGKTLGTPICVVVENTDQRSSDYEPDHFRAGHADRVWQEKYGHRDYRGGGRASGRETLSRVIGGTVARKMLAGKISVSVFTRQIGVHRFDGDGFFTREEVDASAVRMPDAALSHVISDELVQCKKDGDSRGGIVEIVIDGAPVGLGEPVFRKFKSELANACMGIGAVVGFSLGDSDAAVRADGKTFHTGDSGSSERAGISPAANGVQGGLTNGERIIARVMFKPASTVGKKAREGRHDPCIVPRAVPVVEAMTWIVLADFVLAQRMDRWP